jgi:hypothetical protein
MTEKLRNPAAPAQDLSAITTSSPCNGSSNPHARNPDLLLTALQLLFAGTIATGRN